MVARSGKGWKLAPSLGRLIDEVDDEWPKRDRSSDGSIGDASHAARASEHNPDRDSDGMPRGYVSAVDITKDSAAQIEQIRKALIRDPRTWYVIHNGYIYSRTYGFTKRRYTGSNPHTHHLHVSLVQSKAAAENTHSWGLETIATYLVRAGDTLGEIADRHNTTVRRLVDLNRIKDPDVLQVGQKLRLR